MDQVILLYCDKYYAKKLCYQFRFYSILRNNFITRNALSQPLRRIVNILYISTIIPS